MRKDTKEFYLFQIEKALKGMMKSNNSYERKKEKDIVINFINHLEYELKN